MKLSKKSKQLILFLTKNNHINKVKQTKQTYNIISELYNDIYDAYMFLQNLKQIQNDNELSENKIFCNYCNNIFTKKTNLTRHIKLYCKIKQSNELNNLPLPLHIVDPRILYRLLFVEYKKRNNLCKKTEKTRQKKKNLICLICRYIIKI